MYDYLTHSTLPEMEQFAQSLFRPNDISCPEASFTRLFELHLPRFEAILHDMLALWNTNEHIETIGHDRTHITFDLLEWLYFQSDKSIPKSERYMTLFGALLHDLGRYPELLFAERSGAIDFGKSAQIQLHAAFSGRIGIELFMEYCEFFENENDPEVSRAAFAFFRRVIAAVLFHGGKNETRDIVAHHVQSCDRLAGIVGVRQLPRVLNTDCGQRGARVYPDEALDYSRSFPMFNNLPPEKFEGASEPKLSWTNAVHYLEMPMRNIFPLSTEAGTKRATAMRIESGIILGLLAGGAGTLLFRQIFAPELDADGTYAFPKTRLPDDVWIGISKFFEQDGDSDLPPLSQGALLKCVMSQQAPDITAAGFARAKEVVAGVPPEHDEHIRLALAFTVERRRMNVEAEAQFNSGQCDSEDPLAKIVANSIRTSQIFA